jgi:osmotically inducible protein OsmC
MNEHTAVIQWERQGKRCQGQISTETGALKHYPYGFASRFKDDLRSTNPEEFLVAAQAACFTTLFSFANDKSRLAPVAERHVQPPVHGAGTSVRNEHVAQWSQTLQ